MNYHHNKNLNIDLSMKPSLLVTIIIVVKNARETIGKAVQSVVRQTYPAIEFIIVDGFSDDGTFDEIKKFFKYIDIFISEKDNGIYDAMNKAVKLSHGEIIYFLGADDYLLDDNIIEKIINKYINCHFDLLYGDVVIYNSWLRREDVKHGELKIKDLKYGLCPPHQAVFMRRQVIIENGLFDTNYLISADFDLIIKIYNNKNYQIHYYNQKIAYYSTNGISSKKIIPWEGIQIITNRFGIYYGTRFFLHIVFKNFIKYHARKIV